MELHFVYALITGVYAGCYVMLATIATQRGLGLGRITRYLLCFCFLSAAWQTTQFFLYIGSGSKFGQSFIKIETNLGISLLFSVFFIITIEYLGKQTKYIWLPMISLAISFFSILLLVVGPKHSDFFDNTLNITFLGLISLEIIFSIATVLNSFQSAEYDAQRRKLFVWLVSIVLFTLGSFTSIILKNKLAGDFIVFLGFSLSGAVIFIKDRQDLMWTGKRILAFLTQAVLGFVIYFSTFLIPLQAYSFGRFDGEQIDLSLRVFFLVLVLTPILTLISESISRIFFGLQHHQTTLVRNFGVKIQGILSTKLLVQTSVISIRELFGIEYCALIIATNTDSMYEFRNFNSPNFDDGPPTLQLSKSSSFVNFLRNRRKPFYREEIVSARSQMTIPIDVKHWISEQPYLLFAPMYSDQEMIGFIALSGKVTGENFYPQDIDLLALLSDQIPPVLTKAMLFENALKLNAELKQTQADLLQTNLRLKEMDEMKSAFIGILSHELRTPIANIQFSLQVFEMYLKSQLSQEQKSQLDELSQSVTAARKIVDRLVLFASFLNKNVSLDMQINDGREIIKKSLTLVKPQVEKKMLKLHLKFIGDQFLIVVDRKLLQEALNQLLSNAVRFTPKGDIWITCWTTDKMFCIDIKDTGIGMEAENLAQAWELFTQFASDPVSRGVEGFGLGLSLVRHIVHAHGGKVWAESVPGRGSTFGFQIPLTGPESS